MKMNLAQAKEKALEFGLSITKHNGHYYICKGYNPVADFHYLADVFTFLDEYQVPVIKKKKITTKLVKEKALELGLSITKHNGHYYICKGYNPVADFHYLADVFTFLEDKCA